MPSITQFRKPVETSEVVVRDLPIQVTYDPDSLTMDDVAAVAQAEKTGDLDALTRFLVRLIDAWDITGPLYTDDEDGGEEPVELVAEGETIPITHACVGALGFSFLMELMDEMRDKVIRGPKPTTAKPRSRKR